MGPALSLLVRIEEVRPDDVRALDSVLRAVYGHSYERDLNRPLDWILRQDSDQALCAFDLNGPVGAIMLHLSPHQMLLGALGVIKIAEGHGIATRLISRGVEIAEGRGLSRVIAAVDPTGHWIKARYEALGFEPIWPFERHDQLLLGKTLLQRSERSTEAVRQPRAAKMER